jgi:Protein of unknown function (DUF3179)
VLVPFFVIQPFKAQTSNLLQISYSLRSWSEIITITALILGILIQYVLWRKTQRWVGKLLIVVMIFPLLASAWFARQNHFEWMFTPLHNTDYTTTSQANFVKDEDMVLAIELNGEAVAYPVKQLAYHHIVQDTVGGIPIVATY